MFRVLTCLAYEHDWRLVALAGAVCFAASLVAINLFHSALESKAQTRLIWIAIAGGAIGYGIWATHFVAMLAYDPGVVMGYAVVSTALSLLAAMVLTSTGFAFAAGGGNWGAPLGGGAIGVGIATMHYLGMWALEVPGRAVWAADLVIVSVVLGVALAIAALTAAVRIPGRRGTIIAAILLTLAIVAHHFTAMGAVEIVPDPARTPAALFLSPNVLALAIAGVALSVLGMSFIGALADRRLSTRTKTFREIISQLSQAQQEVEASRQELQDQKMRLNTAINNMSQGLLLFDASERIVVCNERFIEMYGLCTSVVKPGCSYRELVRHGKDTGTFRGDTEEYRAILLRHLADGRPTELLFTTPDGRSVRVVNQPLPDGGWLATHDDVTERQRSEARIAYLAHHDMLTGLANRTTVAQKIEEAAARERRWREPFSVLLLDLDRFKHVNDTLGHPAGDALLREVAMRLKACTREVDVLGRLGGDEFAIILSVRQGDQREGAQAFADRIISVIAEPFSIDGNQINIGTSIGIALAPEHATGPDELLKMADLALYRAKSSGRNSYQFFSVEMHEAAGARRRLEVELRQAIQNGELSLHYQPIIDSRSRRVCAAEALIRWKNPRMGMIPPDQFIPLAEECGLVTQIGEWVLNTACTEAATWPAGIKIAVNLSPVQLRKANLSEIVMNALAQSGLSPKRLELEITETALIELGTECLPVLHQFKRMGIAVALDDFGTGYSSLSHLTMFPFDKIKIDKTFTQNISKRADCAAIISATLTLAKSLNIATTAEGVETLDQFRLLRLAGVTSLQGYLFARPAPASELDFTRVHGDVGVENAA